MAKIKRLQKSGSTILQKKSEARNHSKLILINTTPQITVYSSGYTWSGVTNASAIIWN
jgi:hypothetical protein